MFSVVAALLSLGLAINCEVWVWYLQNLVSHKCYCSMGINLFLLIQVPLVASNRIGKEIIQTEHGNSEITFYGNSFIAGTFHSSFWSSAEFNLLSYPLITCMEFYPKINFISVFYWTEICNSVCLQWWTCLNIDTVIIGPTGEIVAAADDKEEAVVVAQFDLDKIKSKRYSWGIFRDRRPDLYKVLLTLDGSKPWLCLVSLFQ